MESLDKDSDKVDKYEEYIFVERRRYGARPKLFICYEDVLISTQTKPTGTSNSLADTLREILKDVSTVSMRGDKVRLASLILPISTLSALHDIFGDICSQVLLKYVS